MSTASILLVLALIAFAALIVRHAFSRTMSSDQVAMAVLAVGLLIAGGGMQAANNRNTPSPAPKQQGTPQTQPSIKPTEMEMLAGMHRASVEVFVNRPGFGQTRMWIPDLEDEYFKPQQGVATSSEIKATKGPESPGDLQNKKNQPPHMKLQTMVAMGRLKSPNFLYLGLKQKQFQLVGLVQHAEPRVYLTDRPLINKDDAIPTRDLNDFENRSLAALRSGEHLKVEEREGTLRMLAPIYAGRRCVECHQRGQMLGAFTYVFERDPNYNPELP